MEMERSAGRELGVGALLLDAPLPSGRLVLSGLCFQLQGRLFVWVCLMVRALNMLANPDAVVPSTLVGRVAFRPGAGPGPGGPALWIPSMCILRLKLIDCYVLPKFKTKEGRVIFVLFILHSCASSVENFSVKLLSSEHANAVASVAPVEKNLRISFR